MLNRCWFVNNSWFNREIGKSWCGFVIVIGYSVKSQDICLFD